MFQKILLSAALILGSMVVNSQHRIHGKVEDAQSGESLPGAHIAIMPQGGHLVNNAFGNFRSASLRSGFYQLKVSFIGYQTQTQDIDLKRDTTIVIHLRAESFMSDEVVVKASRLPKDNPYTFSVLSSSDIQKNNNGADLPFLLQMTPSLVAGSDAGTGIGYTSLRIRGTDLTRINVTLNGVPVNDPESHEVYFVNLPDLSSSIDNIQIQRGVGSSINGAAAFGASINIKTTESQSEASANISTTAGAFGTLKNTAIFSTGTGKHGFSLDGRLSHIRSDGYVDRAWARMGSFYLAGSWASEKTIVKLLTTGGKQRTYQAWYGIPKDSLSTNRTYNPAGEMLDSNGRFKGFYDNQTDNYQQDYYQFHFAHQLKPEILFTATAFLTNGKGYYESYKNNQKFSNYGFKPVVIQNDTVRRSNLVNQKWLDNRFYGTQLNITHTSRFIETVAGLGLNRYVGDHFGYIVFADIFPAESTKEPWYFNAGNKTDFSAFAKSAWKMTNRLSLFADLQYRQIDYVMQGTHDNLTDISQTHRFSFVNPKFGFLFRPTKNIETYANFAISNREPNRSVYKDANPGQIVKPEHLTDVELGVKYTLENLKIESNLFYMTYRDQLVLTGKINNVGAAVMTNVPESYRAGWETNFLAVLNHRLSVSGNWSLSTNKIKHFVEYVDNWNYWDDPDNQPYQYEIERHNTNISFSPSFTAAIGINWEPFKQTNLIYQSQFVGRQYIDNTSDISRSLDPYHTASLNLSYTWHDVIFPKMQLGLQLSNLFNVKYETNAWVYRYYYNGEAGQTDGYFPQAGLHWMIQLNLGF